MQASSKHNAWTLFAKLKPLAALWCIPMMTGCLGIGSTATITDSGCVIFQPIFYSEEQDSIETVRQVRAHNNVWVTTCDASSE